MRIVKSDFARGSAAKEEKRGAEANPVPSALAPVTARNSLRFSMFPLKLLPSSSDENGLQTVIIQSAFEGLMINTPIVAEYL
jgi:hypothetical protein